MLLRDRHVCTHQQFGRVGKSAYMLVYVAEGQASDLLRPCELEDIPLQLRERYVEHVHLVCLSFYNGLAR